MGKHRAPRGSTTIFVVAALLAVCGALFLWGTPLASPRPIAPPPLSGTFAATYSPTTSGATSPTSGDTASQAAGTGSSATSDPSSGASVTTAPGSSSGSTPGATAGPTTGGTAGSTTGGTAESASGSSSKPSPRGSATSAASGSGVALPGSRPTAPALQAANGSCRAGAPGRLVYPALGVNAPFERIGLDRTARPDASGRYPIGNPRDRTNAGWYAAGPKPGAGKGTVITNGHTYRNGSAIFTENFANQIEANQLIHVVQADGGRCSYAVTRIWREVNAKRDYPRIVAGQKLYNFAGPERLLLVTCGGSWNAAAQNYDEISIVLATRVDG